MVSFKAIRVIAPEHVAHMMVGVISLLVSILSDKKCVGNKKTFRHEKSVVDSIRATTVSEVAF